MWQGDNSHLHSGELELEESSFPEEASEPLPCGPGASCARADDELPRQGTSTPEIRENYK